MTRFYKRLSIKAKFNLIIVGLFIVMGTVAMLAFNLVAREVLQSFAMRSAAKQAQLLSGRLEAVVSRELALSNALATDPAVVDWILHEHDARRMDLAMSELDNYKRHFHSNDAFVAVAASRSYYVRMPKDSKERTRTSTLNPDNPFDSWFFRVMSRVDDYELNMDYEPVLGKAKVWFNVVIRDQAGRKIGATGTGIDVSDFISLVVASSEAGVQAQIIDAKGSILAHPDRAIVEHNAKHPADPSKHITIFSRLRQPRDVDKFHEALTRLDRGQDEAIAIPVKLDSGLAVVGISPMKAFGWYNVVAVDVANVVNSSILWPLLAVLMAVLLTAVLAVSLLVGRIVIRPLTSLTGATRRITEGEYAISLPESRSDEIGQLTSSFNVMAAKIQDYTRNLESMVRDRTLELTRANSELSSSRQRILESLHYAQTIQRAILPRPEAMEKAFREYMVIYQPRDIVGGDLYYFRDFGDHFLIALLDCTGHGVPGAFMTMIAHSVLNHVIGLSDEHDPGRILSQTDRVLRDTLRLHDTGEGALDCGLEMAICVCYPRKSQMVYAGAGLPLYIHSAGEVSTMRADRQRIGYRGAFSGVIFTNHELAILPDDRFYLSTDGFLDEGGGPKGFSFGTGRFIDMILAHAGKNMAVQAQEFETTLDVYRGTRPRRDDIAVIGFRL